MKWTPYLSFFVACVLTLVTIGSTLSRNLGQGSEGSTTYLVPLEVKIAALSLALIGFLAARKLKIWSVLYFILLITTWAGFTAFMDQSFSFGLNFISIDPVILSLLLAHLSTADWSFLGGSK